MQLEIGATFTRQQISEMLGGSPVSFLPVSGGRVVCGCFVQGPKMNPHAPEEVLFGTAGESPDINKSADLVFRQGQEGEAVPVFLKRGPGDWEYEGEFLCIGITRDKRVIDRKKQQWPDRGDFHGVLRFERV